MSVYSTFQFEDSGFNAEGYVLNEKEGNYIGKLMCKKYGKKCNIIAYVILDDGRKIICTAFQNQKDYLGLKDIEVGSKLELTYSKSKTGKIQLSDLKVV